jgi:hypothetical protein
VACGAQDCPWTPSAVCLPATRGVRRWQLDHLAAFRRQEPRQERVCGCGDRGPEEEEDPPSARTRTHCNSGLTPFGSPLKQECAGCGAEALTHPCARCWEVWYCTDYCARVHWQQHHTQCERGAWCGGCSNESQSAWCEECNGVAYCSRECRELSPTTPYASEILQTLRGDKRVIPTLLTQ